MAGPTRRRRARSGGRRATRLQRQRREQRLVWLLGGLFLLLVGSLLGWGYYQERVAPWRAVVVRVNQRTVDMSQYVERLRLAELESRLEGRLFNRGVEPIALLAALQEEEMLLQLASQEGVTASNSEVEAELKRLLGAHIGIELGPAGELSPEEDVRIEAHYASLRAETGLSREDLRRWAEAGLLRKALRRKLERSLPEALPQARIQAMVARSRDAAQQALARVRAGEQWSAVTGGTPSSPSSGTVLASGLEWVPRGVMGEDFDRELFGLEEGRVSPYTAVEGGFLIVRVEERRGAESAPGQEQVRASIILLGDEGAAREALRRLNGGESFAEVAQEMSLDEASRETGGAIGWVSRGVRRPEFDRLAFGLAPGELGGPVATAEGWYVVRLLERSRTRPLDDEVRRRLAERALSEWFSEKRQTNRVESYLDSTRYQFALEHL